MRIEFDIPDISREEIINAMAHRLLSRWSDDDGETPTDLGKSLASAVSQRIDAIAADVVQKHFDNTIRERIAAAVDAVIAEGWYESDSYGGKLGERIDLKARINKALTEPRSDAFGHGRKPSLLQERLDKAAESLLDREFKDVVEQAKTALRQKLDGVVMAKVASSIKEALGLR